MSSPDGQVSGVAETCRVRDGCIGEVARCHPDDLPEGYHTAGERQGWQMTITTIPWLPPTADVIGPRQVDGMARLYRRSFLEALSRLLTRLKYSCLMTERSIPSCRAARPLSSALALKPWNLMFPELV